MQQEILSWAWDYWPGCVECPLRTRRGVLTFCEASQAEDCPGASAAAEDLLLDFDPYEVEYLSKRNPLDPEGLFLLGYAEAFGWSLNEAQSRAERFFKLRSMT